ncbi:50S ribosomal protein L25 [Chloroflexota bacterium]
MVDLVLKADKREILGKKTSSLRQQGITPTHLFGHGIESMALQCDTAELQRIIRRGGSSRLINISITSEKQPRSAFIREIQQDTFNGQLLHVDFYQVNKLEKITADIPIILTGEAPAIKSRDNMIEHMLNQLGVECLPEKLPPRIEIDLGMLEEAGQAIHVKDINLGADITVTTDLEQIIVKVSRIKVAAEEIALEEAEAEAAEAAEIKATEGAEAPAEGETKEQES